MHFFNRVFGWIPLLHRNGSDHGRIIFNSLAGGFVIIVTITATSYMGMLIANRAARVHEKLLFAHTLEDNRDMFASLNAKYGELAPILPALYGALLKEEDILVFSDTVEKIGKDTGNKVTFQFDSQEPAVEAVFPDVSVVHFSAVLSGNYGSFVQFLSGLARSHYFMTLDQMTIENSESLTAQSKMSVKGAVFIQRKS